MQSWHTQGNPPFPFHSLKVQRNPLGMIVPASRTLAPLAHAVTLEMLNLSLCQLPEVPRQARRDLWARCQCLAVS